MRAAAAVVVVVALAGCSVGAGSAYVGQWRARDVVEFAACLEDDHGRCVDEKQVTTHQPARRFWGVTASYPALGAASVTSGDEVTTRLRGEASVGFVRGEGRVAWGVRASFMLDLGADLSVPVTGLGHLSLSERIAVHAGLGYAPYTRRFLPDEAFEVSYLGARGLAGVQYALGRHHGGNSYWVLTFEADTLVARFDHLYRSSALTGHLGLYF